MALKALTRILPYCSENFEIESQRQLIMTTLFSAMKMPHEEIQLLVFYALQETVFIGYDYLLNYI